MNFSKSAQHEINQNDKYIYYNMVLSNIDSQDYDIPKQLLFTDKRDSPILNRMSDYKMSIVRFELSTWTLPVFYFQTKTNSSDPDEGIYSITMEYTDGISTITGVPEQVYFVPQDKSKPVAPPASSYKYGVSMFNEYYYIYNFNNFISMINTTLELAFTKLQVLTGSILTSCTKPIMVWNSEAQTASIYVQKDYYDTSKIECVKIYFNRALYSLFNSFPSFKYTPSSDGKHYQILTDARDGLSCVTVPEYSPNVMIKVDQEFSTVESWTIIDSIVFTTTLPVLGTQLSNPTVFENGNQLYLADKYNLSQTIITDFQSSENNYRSTLFYTPQGENRWVSFLNNEMPLTEITIFCFIRDRFGFLRPFWLPSNSKCSLKILFERVK